MTAPGFLLVAAYVVLVCLPGLLAVWLGPPGTNWLYEAGKVAALTGATILLMQAVLAARWKWLNRPFGLDIVFRYHRRIAEFAGVLLLAHPILLAAGGAGFGLLVELQVPWYIWMGKIALFLLILNILLSIFRKRIHLSFERWRLGHDVLFVLILAVVFLHSGFVGDDMHDPVFKWIWLGLGVVCLLVFVQHRFIRPAMRRRYPFRVTDVRKEADGAWTVALEPPAGQERPAHHPGQFHFITLHRGRDLPEEEHHFTISSSAQSGPLTSTIKALGDFTATIKDTRIGDTASIQGPYGRFSYRLHPDENDLVFVAGGIGITPLMSMLRTMRDQQDDRRVLLLYGNPTEKGIVFQQELAAIEGGEFPKLRVVHVLSKAGDDWTGEKGSIDREKLERYVEKPLSGKAFYICGPGPLLDKTIASLKQMGVKDRQIRIEIFSLVD